MGRPSSSPLSPAHSPPFSPLPPTTNRPYREYGLYLAPATTSNLLICISPSPSTAPSHPTTSSSSSPSASSLPTPKTAIYFVESSTKKHTPDLKMYSLPSTSSFSFISPEMGGRYDGKMVRAEDARREGTVVGVAWFRDADKTKKPDQKRGKSGYVGENGTETGDGERKVKTKTKEKQGIRFCLGNPEMVRGVKFGEMRSLSWGDREFVGSLPRPMEGEFDGGGFDGGSARDANGRKILAKWRNTRVDAVHNWHSSNEYELNSIQSENRFVGSTIDHPDYSSPAPFVGSWRQSKIKPVEHDPFDDDQDFPTSGLMSTDDLTTTFRWRRTRSKSSGLDNPFLSRAWSLANYKLLDSKNNIIAVFESNGLQSFRKTGKIKIFDAPETHPNGLGRTAVDQGADERELLILLTYCVIEEKRRREA